MTDGFLTMTLNTTVALFVINAMLLCLLRLQGPGAENDSYASSLIENKEFFSWHKVLLRDKVGSAHKLYSMFPLKLH